jgi:hypothetical protein
MKIKIKKNECLFSEEGLHICDQNGIALTASEDTECEIAEEHFERVKQLVISHRLRYGFDEDGNIPQPKEEPVAEEPSSGEVNG